MNQIIIVALGPGAREYLTLGALDAMRSAETLILRTGMCDAAAYVKQQGIAFETLDALHESCEDFDELIDAAVQSILSAAEKAPVAYAVFDPTADETVAALQKKARLSYVAGVPLCAPVMLSAGLLDSVAAVPAHTQETRDAPYVLTELDNALLAGQTKLRLMDIYGENARTLFFCDAPDSVVRPYVEIPLYELDRQKGYGHTAAAVILPAPIEKKERYQFSDLVRIMAQLCGDNGCAWDKAQTHKTLAPYLIEEAYETACAIDEEDDDHVADELGDVLLQVVFHAIVGERTGAMTLHDITTHICQKMVERHPHIFGDVRAEGANKVSDNWEAIKRAQRGLKTETDALMDVPRGLPPLMRAQKVQKKAASIGFDFSSPQEALKKVHEEAQEVLEEIQKGGDIRTELGDLFFSVVNVSRLCGVDCETAVSKSVEKFISRFEKMEKLAQMDGKSLKLLTISEMDVYWNSSKHRC